MMKAGVDVDVTDLDKAHPFKVFANFNYFFRMEIIKEHSSYSFTFPSIITVWLHENIAPISDGKGIVNNLTGL